MSGFVFKQFQVVQSRTAMKVSTDGILLGAWADLNNAECLLDIGSGTGLLALMCKQRKPKLRVSAVEIEDDATLDANENIANSPWPDIKLHHSSIQNYKTSESFDVVISNPPYFNQSLKGKNRARNQARHTDTLSFKALVESFLRLSHSESVFHLILPSQETPLFIIEAQALGLHLQRLCEVHSTPKKPPSRNLMTFGYQNRECIKSQLCIYDDNNNYSHDYKLLCNAFYLKM